MTDHMEPQTKYREPWYMEPQDGLWVITDGVESFPITHATPVEFGFALQGTVERELAAALSAALVREQTAKAEQAEAYDAGYAQAESDVYRSISESEESQ